MSKEVNRDKIVTDLKACVNQLDKVLDDVMALEEKELSSPIEQLVSDADNLLSYNIFRSIMELKNTIVMLVGGDD